MSALSGIIRNHWKFFVLNILATVFVYCIAELTVYGWYWSEYELLPYVIAYSIVLAMVPAIVDRVMRIKKSDWTGSWIIRDPKGVYELDPTTNHIRFRCDQISRYHRLMMTAKYHLESFGYLKFSTWLRVSQSIPNGSDAYNEYSDMEWTEYEDVRTAIWYTDGRQRGWVECIAPEFTNDWQLVYEDQMLYYEED